MDFQQISERIRAIRKGRKRVANVSNSSAVLQAMVSAGYLADFTVKTGYIILLKQIGDTWVKAHLDTKKFKIEYI